jgi:hypothetical protein
MYRQKESEKIRCVTYNIDLHSYVTKLHSFGPIPVRVLHLFGSVVKTRVYVNCVVKLCGDL